MQPITINEAGQNALDAAMQHVAEHHPVRTGPVTDATIKSETIVKKTTPHVAIAYNPYSLDSLMGAAQAIFHPDYHKARLVPYNQFASTDTLMNYTKILFVGVEITQLDFAALMSGTQMSVQLVAYRDSYSWMDEKAIQKLGERVSFLRPSDEFINELLARTDNTATKIVQFWVDKSGEGRVPGVLYNLTSLVSRMVSQSYPILSFHVDLNEGTMESEEEMSNKARIHDAVAKLRTALGSVEPMNEVLGLTFKADVDAYLSHFRHVRYTLTRSLRMMAFRQATGALSSTVIELPVVPASEMTHSDILHAALQHYKEVVTYEDVREYRIWRIYSEKAQDRQKLVHIFKPVMVWSEGAVLCALTHTTTSTA